MTEDEMVRYHHRLNRHEFEQTPGNSRGQRDRGKPKEIKRLLNNLELMKINLKKSFKLVYPVFFLSTLPEHQFYRDTTTGMS